MTIELKAVSQFGEIRVEEKIGHDMELLNNGQVTIDGFAVPNLVVRGVSAEDGVVTYHITLHNRFGYFVTGKEQIYTVLSLVANAMAIASGYSCFGENLRPMNEFNVMPLGSLGIKG
jgi:hypothetical protein